MSQFLNVNNININNSTALKTPTKQSDEGQQLNQYLDEPISLGDLTKNDIHFTKKVILQKDNDSASTPNGAHAISTTFKMKRMSHTPTNHKTSGGQMNMSYKKSR